MQRLLTSCRRTALALWLGWVALDAAAAAPLAANEFRRARTPNRYDAELHQVPLAGVLKQVATATGWTVFMEPGMERLITTRFKNTPRAEALKLIFGDMSFALLPDRGGTLRLLVFQTSPQKATERIEGDPNESADGKSRALPLERIVRLKPGAKESAEDLAKRLNATMIGRADALGAYRLKFDSNDAARAADAQLASDPDASIEGNYGLDRPIPPERIGSTAETPFPLRPRVSTDASKVIIGLIDSPVQTLPPDMASFILPGITTAGTPAPAAGQLSHGTSMAATILQGLARGPVEPGGSSVRILPVDIYGASEDTTTFEVAKGVYAAIEAGATVINLSLAGEGDSRFLSSLIQDARSQGVLFVAAAGNEPTTAQTYPAAYPEVVAVTASDRRGQIAPYANRGSFVDVIAPGTSLVPYAGDSFIVSGTSTSTAYVTGLTAGQRANGQTADQAEAAIRAGLAVKTPAAGGAVASPVTRP